MQNTAILVDLLEKKAIALKSKTDALRVENQSLKNEILKLSDETNQLKKEILYWKEKHQMLQVAMSILGSNEERKNAKLKINALIREIDACIKELSNS